MYMHILPERRSHAKDSVTTSNEDDQWDSENVGFFKICISKYNEMHQGLLNTIDIIIVCATPTHS